MKQIEKEVKELLKEVMTQCKRERKAKTKLSNKQLAAKLEITENYLSALESARATPSLQMFFRYLIQSGFDVSSLKFLEINEKEMLRPLSKMRSSVVQKIYSLDEDQIGYLSEQTRIAELFDLRIKSKAK